MREIKFRAWDKEDRMMKRVTLMDFPEWSVCVQNGEECYEIGDRNSFENEETDRCILMQYTGLHDKNGKEIYEGDVLLSIFVETGPIEEKEMKDYSVVEWSELHGAWQVNGLYLVDLLGYETGEVSNDVEVIGNIYENKELI